MASRGLVSQRYGIEEALNWAPSLRRAALASQTADVEFSSMVDHKEVRSKKKNNVHLKKKSFSNSFQIEGNTIVVTICLLIINPTDFFRLVHIIKRKTVTTIILLSIGKLLEKIPLDVTSKGSACIAHRLYIYIHI